MYAADEKRRKKANFDYINAMLNTKNAASRKTGDGSDRKQPET